MSTFVGVGLGPIQTGIFLSGASLGGFDRIVIAEVDEHIQQVVNACGGEITINIAGEDRVYRETFTNIEVYNPRQPTELEKLIAAAAEADELATALPSVNFFAATADWLREGFSRNPDKLRFIYTAENNNHAAEELTKAVGHSFNNTHYLNTVVGKMSGVVPAAECQKQNLATLCPSADRGHLVEEFNRILISEAPGIEKRKVQGLLVKNNLYPFEEAKLYGHNAIHFLLGILGKQAGREYMSELRELPELMQTARNAFVNESGAALCAKWDGVDSLFTPQGYQEYADDLLQRMTNPFLRDAIDRITRDLWRKLGWNDRIIGTMRVVLEQGIQPEIITRGAKLAAIELFDADPLLIKTGLEGIWPSPWRAEQEKLFQLIISADEKSPFSFRH